MVRIAEGARGHEAAIVGRDGGQRRRGSGDVFGNDEIGVALGIGSKTVETHLHRLYERFGIASRAELAARALQEGWLEIPD